MKTSSPLFNHEQRGTLTYSLKNGNLYYATGWFYLNGNNVVMRKIGGRNRFMLCGENCVISFKPYQK